MRRWVERAGRVLFCFLLGAPVLAFAGELLLDRAGLGLLLLGGALGLSLCLSAVPGQVGGRRAAQRQAQEQEALARRRAQNDRDPNPDRNLREGGMPEPVKRRTPGFPLRLALTLLSALGLWAALALSPGLGGSLVGRLATGAALAVLLVLSVRELAAPVSQWCATPGVTAGVALYALAGACAFFVGRPHLDGVLLALGLLFLVAALWVLSVQSMLTGVASSQGRPPRALVRMNGLLLTGFVGITLLVVFFDRLREGVQRAARAAALGFIRFLSWLGALFASDEMAEGGMGGSAEMGMGLPAGEPSPFWQVMEKLLYALALAAAALMAVYLARKLYQLARRALRYLSAQFRQLAQSVGEDYRDERQSLLDWEEMRKSAGEELRRRVKRLTHREKRWEQMDAREKVRHVVRGLYRRQGGRVEGLRSLTIREAAGRMDVGQASPEALCALYERARYGPEPPQEREAEQLRREVRG